LRVLLGLVAFVLLLSMGGAVLAAPVTLPLLWWAGRSARPPARAAFDALAVLTAAEAAWALVYVTAGERTPLAWAVPVAAGVAVALGYPLTQRRA
jgi:hypothetical protein